MSHRVSVIHTDTGRPAQGSLLPRVLSPGRQGSERPVFPAGGHPTARLGEGRARAGMGECASFHRKWVKPARNYYSDVLCCEGNVF